MNKYIPSFQSSPIEREKIFKLPAKEHSSQKKNEQEAAKQVEILARLHKACEALKNSNPTAWETLEYYVRAFYASSVLVSRATPMDIIGARLDSGHWALVQAYASGQQVILESMFENLQIKSVSETLVKEKESFFRFAVDRFRRIWSKR